MDSVLHRTSRTFALSMQLLPVRMRRPVELAYLLARAADTIADTGLVSPEIRGEALSDFRKALKEGGVFSTPLRSGGSQVQPSPESLLLSRTPELFSGAKSLNESDRHDVIEVVDRLVSTMEGELGWFGAESAEPRTAWPTPAALTAYTEGIAGCVGEFWTRLLARHAVRLGPARERAMIVLGRRYGRGLQLVNILRDLPRDLRRGRCFLPETELRSVGLTPQDLLNPVVYPRLEPLLNHLETRSRLGLLAGLIYGQKIPWPHLRLRTATALPAVLGFRTVALLRREAEARLDPGRIIRLTRREVRGALLATLAAAWRPGGMAQQLWNSLKKSEEEVL